MNQSPFFTYKHKVEETGAELEFVYEPPEDLPTLEDDPVEYTKFHKYLEWLEKYEADIAKYKIARNKLILGLAVKIARGPSNWQTDYDSGEWIENLAAAGIEVTKTNRKILYLKTKILSEADYIKVIDAATVEEVTMADVELAFDRFQSLLQRFTTLAGYKAPTGGEDQSVDDVLGNTDGNSNGDKGGDVVHAASEGTSSYGSD